jgi:hypothetical protein
MRKPAELPHTYRDNPEHLLKASRTMHHKRKR